MQKFITSIKKKYSERRINRQKQWPPRHGEKLVRLELVHGKREGYSNQKGIEKNKISKRSPLSYADLFKVESGRQPVRRILAEGDAGIGKTTLCVAVSEGWAAGKLFQEFELVLHLPLREKSVASATTLPELLGLLHPNQEARLAVTQYLEDEEGDNILVLADGWDELGESKRHPDTFLYNFLLGDQYPFLSVLLTSRPSASGALHRHENLDRFVEVCGFSKENIREYIFSEFESNQKKASHLVQQVGKNFLLQSVCVVPLNCAIVCHLWRTLEETLPTTMTGLYTKLILHTLRRSIEKISSSCDVTSLTSFDNLPLDLHEPWSSLCKFAFDSLEKDQITFSRDEVYHNGRYCDEIHSFGLLQFADSILEGGVSLSMHFLHLTFQEYLAAWHLAKLPLHALLTLCRVHGVSYRFSMVWRFLFGIRFSGLTSHDLADQDSEVSLMDEIMEVFFSEDTPLNGSFLCHCGFEASNDIVDDILLSTLGNFNFVFPTSTFDCVAVLHVISKIKYFMKKTGDLRLHFRQCGLGENEITLLGEVLAKVPRGVGVTLLDLRGNGLQDVGISNLFIGASKAFEDLAVLNLNNNCIKGEAIGILTNCAPTLKKICLSENKLEPAALKLLENVSKFNNMKILRLKGCLPPDANVTCSFLASFLESLVQHCNLLCLDLSDNNLGLFGAVVLGDYIPLLGKRSSPLRLSIKSNNLGDEGLVALLDNCVSDCFFEQLGLEDNDIHGTGLLKLLELVGSKILDLNSLSLADNPLGQDGTIALIKTLSVNPVQLEELDLSRCGLNVGNFSAFADSIHASESDVEKLTLDGNGFSGENINTLAFFIHLCPYLDRLSSCACNITSADFTALLEQLAMLGHKTASLESWLLTGNCIDGNGVLKSIEYLRNVFPYLKSIDIDGNPVDVEVKKVFQTAISNQGGDHENLEMEYKKLVGRLQHNADVGELLSSDDDGEDELSIYNRVNEMIAKWENDPSKQPYMADLKRLRDIFITAAQGSISNENSEAEEVLHKVDGLDSISESDHDNSEAEKVLHKVEVLDEEHQLRWISGMDYLYRLAVDYLFCQTNIKLVVVGEGTSSSPHFDDDDDGYQADEEVEDRTPKTLSFTEELVAHQDNLRLMSIHKRKDTILKTTKSTSDSQRENLACAKASDEVEKLERCKDNDDPDGFYTPPSSPNNVIEFSETKGDSENSFCSLKPELKDLDLIKLVNWQGVGLQLGIEDYELQRIQLDYKQHGDQKREMFRIWLRACPNPNYGDLVKALEAVGEKKVAQEIREKFVR